MRPAATRPSAAAWTRGPISPISSPIPSTCSGSRRNSSSASRQRRLRPGIADQVLKDRHVGLGVRVHEVPVGYQPAHVLPQGVVGRGGDLLLIRLRVLGKLAQQQHEAVRDVAIRGLARGLDHLQDRVGRESMGRRDDEPLPMRLAPAHVEKALQRDRVERRDEPGQAPPQPGLLDRLTDLHLLRHRIR